jgi:hypothetical protein
MSANRRTIAALDVLLLLPAALFMGSLVMREFGSGTAHRIVMWYAGRVWTLWILLIALPLVALLTGAATLVKDWSAEGKLRQVVRQPLTVLRTELALVVIAAATLVAAGILAIVMLHMLST